MAPVPDVKTLIFVDVDGVLNVGIHDDGNAPIAFTVENLQLARKLEGSSNLLGEKIRNVASRQVGGGEDPTFEKLVAAAGDLSDVLVGRLAKIIQAAGSDCSVILSSSWRKPQHNGRTQRLEGAIARHLGRDSFSFDDRTALRNESTAEERLECLGDYISDFCRRRGKKKDRLHILVLEDFCISSLCGVRCRGAAIDGPADAEAYLMGQAGHSPNVTVRVIHTYDGWTTGSGMNIAVGCGLTAEHFKQAVRFLQNTSEIAPGEDVMSSTKPKKRVPWAFVFRRWFPAQS